MSDRVARDPSPFRSGVAHTALSILVFSGLFAVAGAAIHLSGEASEASPARQIALFEPAGPDRPQLKTRFASSDNAARPVIGGASGEAADNDAGQAQEASSPNLGVDYANGGTKVVNASASTGEADTVRINGVSVAAGRSWQETRELKSLSRAPISAVTERTSLGYLPKIAEDGRTPAGAYARPFANPEDRPTVSIVVGGLGINYTHTKSAIEELPPEVTLSFAPTARNLQGWINQARAAGHEVLLEVPMEPYEYGRERPHSHVLDADLTPEQNAGRLDYLMSRASGYFGITNYQGSKFATDEASTSYLSQLLSDRGVAFVEDGSLSRSSFDKAAEEKGLRYRRADNPIDARPDGEEIESKLLELESLAMENGSSLGTGFAYPITIDILKEWTARLDEKGIVLAPASSATRTLKKEASAIDTALLDASEGGQQGG
ncbi:divergent polysaccharide deacetylase family protein [Henriciella sp.]|uniref:divergent polysaccharide deacetylase family protein n=1 Tax=Henriciella sp. TaxID=1968823 RepID=UPI00262343ED|nr:divergent polysaccharide deacetylase family protein [Henriciella sp.]